MNYDEPDPDLVAGMNELAKVNKSLRRARSPAPPRTASALSKFYKISQVLERVPISRNNTTGWLEGISSRTPTTSNGRTGPL